MLKSNKGHVEIKGEATMLFAEFSSLVMALKDSFEKHGVKEPEKKIREALEDGLMPREEFEKKTKELRKEVKSALVQMLLDAFSDDSNDDDDE